MIYREISGRIRQLLGTMPVLTITGPRQSGKTTLCRSLFPEYSYCNLENPQTMDQALADPAGLMRSLGRFAIIDEVQRVPRLLSFIQVEVDREPERETRYVLTGSANLLLMSEVSQTLAGRTAVLLLHPFSLSELEKGGQVFDRWEHIALTGSYPPVHDRKVNVQEWMNSYVQTYVERDVRAILNVRELTQFRTFLRLCAGRAGQVLNMVSLGSDAGLDQKTLRHWLSVLEATHIVYRLPPYFENFSKRLVKAPKLYFVDTGVLCHLLEISSVTGLETHYARGAVFENFCINELRKNAENAGVPPQFYFWRDHNGHEVDCLFENAGVLHCLEMKSGRTINERFFDELSFFRQTAAGRTVRSYVMYGGDEGQQRTAVSVVPWNRMHKDCIVA